MTTDLATWPATAPARPATAPIGPATAPSTQRPMRGSRTEAVNEYLRPVRQRRSALAADPGELRRILRAGNERANAVAVETLAAVRRAMDMAY